VQVVPEAAPVNGVEPVADNENAEQSEERRRRRRRGGRNRNRRDREPGELNEQGEVIAESGTEALSRSQPKQAVKLHR
jgi:ribonuclease E